MPLIGFAGAPFTLASYLVEGGPSKTFARTKTLMHEDARAVARDRRPPGRHRSRVAQGPGRGRRVGGPALRQLGRVTFARRLRDLRPAAFDARCSRAWRSLGVPRIHFGVGTGELLGLMSEAGADVVGVDWRVTLSSARSRIGDGQGRPGEPGPCRLPGACRRRGRRDDQGPPRRGRQARAHLQSGSRRPARDGPGRARPVVDVVHAWQPSSPGRGTGHVTPAADESGSS